MLSFVKEKKMVKKEREKIEEQSLVEAREERNPTAQSQLNQSNNQK